MELSHTRVETYLDCPQRYKFKYLERIREEPRPELEFGKLVHSTLQFLHDPANPETPSASQVAEKYEEGWSLLPEVEGLEPYKPLGLEMLRNYYSAHVPPREEVLAVEQRFRLPLDDHTVRGVLDRVSRARDGTIVITEYKTSRRLPTQPDVERNMQVILYHHSAGELYPGHAVVVRMHFLKFDFVFEAAPTEEAWVEVKGELLRAAYGIEAGNFMAKPGSVCEYCSYLSLCPAMRHLFAARPEEEDLFDGASIKSAVREYVDLKENSKRSRAKIDELSRRIRAYMDAKGYSRLFVDDILLSRVKMKKHDWDESRLVKVLERLGMLESVLGIRTDRVSALLDSGSVSNEHRREIESCERSMWTEALRYRYRDEAQD